MTDDTPTPGYDEPSAIVHLPTLAAMVPFASKDPRRPYLHGVSLTTDADSATYVATNGHVLAARRLVVPDAALRNDLVGSWIIPADICKAVKLGRKDNPYARLHQPAVGTLSIAHDGIRRTFDPVVGAFPDWRSIAPRGALTGSLAAKTKDGRGLTVNGRYLAAIDAFGETLDLGTCAIGWNSGDASVFVWADGSFCLLMPKRTPLLPATGWQPFATWTECGVAS